MQQCAGPQMDQSRLNYLQFRPIPGLISSTGYINVYVCLPQTYSSGISSGGVGGACGDETEQINDLGGRGGSRSVEVVLVMLLALAVVEAFCQSPLDVHWVADISQDLDTSGCHLTASLLGWCQGRGEIHPFPTPLPNSMVNLRSMCHLHTASTTHTHSLTHIHIHTHTHTLGIKLCKGLHIYGNYTS